MIIVANKYRLMEGKDLLPSNGQKVTSIYIGRPSPLGNPFVMADPNDRDRVCNNYAAWLPEAAAEDSYQGGRIRKELNRIAELAREGHVQLVCFCAPKRCHGDTIKAYIEEKLNAELEWD